MKYLTITAILCFILACASFAGNVTVTEVITGGDLTLTMPSNFSLPSIILGGASSQDAAEYSNGICYVEDSRGTGVGWNLGAQINQFQTAGTPARTIPVENFYIVNYVPWNEAVYGQAVDSTYGPRPPGGAVMSVQSSQVEIIHAVSGYGMGKYSMILGAKLTIPANAYAGTYTATLTATLNNTP